MNIKKISNNTTAFIFDNIPSYLTNVLLIDKPSRVYFIDTYCGSDSITPILDSYVDKEVVVINTHFHWDHVWGNCCFRNDIIISHESCRNILVDSWDDQLDKNGMYITGNVEKVLPNTTFSEKLYLHNDEIELFHSPGHTADSISIFDHEEKILYVGDNLEKPIIYVENEDISTYISTLEKYLSYKPSRIVSGHTLDLTEKDLLNTIQYLENLSFGKEMHFDDKYTNDIHIQNMAMIHKK